MSSRSLLRAMTITGSTQAASIVLSIVRMKALALLLGPTGVGVLGLYNSLQTTSSSLAGLGVGNSGVRQIAQSRGDQAELSKVRRVLFLANLIQGAFAMVAIWLLREGIAVWLFGDGLYAFEVGLVGVAVLLSLVSASQTALLRGMRRIGDLGRITVLAALAATVGGIAAVWWRGMDGLLWFVIMQPLTSVLVALHFTRKLPRPQRVPLRVKTFWSEWKPMAQLGAGFMLGGLATSGTMLMVNGRIAGELGLGAAGQFVAAWGLTVTYMGFLLNAMSMDYYPRLSEVIHDPTAASRLMNEQAQIALLIGGPILFAMIGLAPVVVTILYSKSFGDAVVLLQWQMAGNVLKLACWSIGFAFAAAARSRMFLFTQVSFNTVYLAVIWFGLPAFGLEVAGAAFLLAYAVHFGVLNFLVRRVMPFRWERLSLALIGGYTAAAIALLALSLAYPLWGAISAMTCTAIAGFVGGHILLEKIGPSRYTAPLARVYAFCRWPISEHR